MSISKKASQKTALYRVAMLAEVIAIINTFEMPTRFVYQIATLTLSDLYIGSPSFTSNAL